MSKDIYIYKGVLKEMDRSPVVETGIPPEASLFCEDVWSKMCDASGGEEALIIALGVVEDTRRHYDGI